MAVIYQAVAQAHRLF